MFYGALLASIGHNIAPNCAQRYYSSVALSQLVFVRAKRVRGRRYLYLVKGTRHGEKVTQKVLCYLGPLYKLTSGVPEEVRLRIDARLRVDWKEVNDQIGRLPVTFEELSEARRAQLAASARRRGMRERQTKGDLPRAEGELAALSKLARSRFKALFEETGPLTYRMV